MPGRGHARIRRPRSALPLSEFSAGMKARVLGFEENGKLVHRLVELGLTPGSTVAVLKSAPGQPLLLQVRGTRLAIDRETAAQIRAKPLGPHGRGKGLHRRHRPRGGRRWWQR